MKPDTTRGRPGHLSPRLALAAHIGGVLWAATLIVGLALTLARMAKDWLAM